MQLNMKMRQIMTFLEFNVHVKRSASFLLWFYLIDDFKLKIVCMYA